MACDRMRSIGPISGNILPSVMSVENFYGVERIKRDFSTAAQSFCEYVFPCGRCESGEFSVGSLGGEAGDSLKICVGGKKVGLWKDFATGESGNNLLDLLHRVRRNVNFKDTCGEAVNWLSSIISHASKDPHVAKTEHNSKGEQAKPKTHKFNDLKPGERSDFIALANLLSLNVDALSMATNDGVLKFFDHPINGRYWSVVDKQNHVHQDRRLDGKPFILKDGSSTKARTIGSPAFPIGVPTEKSIIVLAEGSSDFLAAYSLIYAEDIDHEIAPVGMLGATNRIHPHALEHFRGRCIIGFPDYDFAGFSGMQRWEEQLHGIAATFNIFDYGGLLHDDGKCVKDLRDFVTIDVDQWENDSDVHYPFSNFISELFKKGAIYVAN